MGNPKGTPYKESRKAKKAFSDYCKLGLNRSLRLLHEMYKERAVGGDPEVPTTNIHTVEDWSARGGWRERVIKFDDEQRALEERLWSERRAKTRLRDFEDADELRDLAKKILKEGPKFLKQQRKVVKDDNGNEKEVVTVQLRLDLALAALKLASGMQRESSGLNNKMEIDIQSGGKPVRGISFVEYEAGDKGVDGLKKPKAPDGDLDLDLNLGDLE